MGFIVSVGLGTGLGIIGAWLSVRWLRSVPSSFQVLVCAISGGLVGAAVHFMDLPSPTERLVTLTMFSILITTSLTEVRGNIIPNDLVLVGLTIAGVYQMAAGNLINGLLGGVLAFGVPLFVTIMWHGAMGLGGVKMAGAVGLFLGWPLTAIWLAVATIVVVITILVALATGRRDSAFPTSPMWGFTLVLALLLGNRIASLLP